MQPLQGFPESWDNLDFQTGPPKQQRCLNRTRRMVFEQQNPSDASDMTVIIRGSRLRTAGVHGGRILHRLHKRRKNQRKGAAFAGLTAQFQMSAQQTDQPSGYGQPQTCAFVWTAIRTLGLCKRFKNQILSGGFNSDAGIFHIKTNPFLSGRNLRIHPNGNTALFRKLYGIAEQIQQTLAEPHRVGINEFGQLRRAFPGKIQPLGAGR